MIDLLLFLCTLVLFLDYMHRFYITKDPEDPETKRWIAEIEADKRREEFYKEDKDNGRN